MSFCYRNKIRIVSIIILTLFAALFTSACGRTRDVNEVRQSRNVSRNSLLHSLSVNRQTKHTEVSADEVLPVISENEVKEGEEPDLEAWYTLMEGFEVFLGGDCELETMIRALKFITKVLEEESREVYD